jgi:hypothetical protein
VSPYSSEEIEVIIIGQMRFSGHESEYWTEKTYRWSFSLGPSGFPRLLPDKVHNKMGLQSTLNASGA